MNIYILAIEAVICIVEIAGSIILMRRKRFAESHFKSIACFLTICFIFSTIVSYFLHIFDYGFIINAIATAALCASYSALTSKYAFSEIGSYVIYSAFLVLFINNAITAVLSSYNTFINDFVFDSTWLIIVTNVIYAGLLLLIKPLRKPAQKNRLFTIIVEVFVCLITFILLFFTLYRAFERRAADSILCIITAALVSIIVVGGAFLVARLIELNKQRSEAQKELAISKLEQKAVHQAEDMYEYVKQWRHDMSNHISSISILAENRQYDAIIDYLDKIGDISKKSLLLVNTGNPAIDATITGKLITAESEGISVNYRITLPPDLSVDVLPVCSILMNLFDNAFYAVKKLTKDQFSVDCLICVKKSILMIEISNPSDGFYKRSGSRLETTKSDPGHGLGLKHIENICHSLNGNFIYEAKPDSFTAKVFIPVKSDYANNSY